jgi:hypothetical protein
VPDRHALAATILALSAHGARSRIASVSGLSEFDREFGISIAIGFVKVEWSLSDCRDTDVLIDHGTCVTCLGEGKLGLGRGGVLVSF